MEPRFLLFNKEPEMFGIPGKQAITITPLAAAQIMRLMENGDTKGLRIGVKKGGCAGMEYTMEHVSEIDPNDEVVENAGASYFYAFSARLSS